MFPAAPGAYGQPPNPPQEASKRTTPHRIASAAQSSAVPVVLCKCKIESSGERTPSIASYNFCISDCCATPMVSPSAISCIPSSSICETMSRTTTRSVRPSYGHSITQLIYPRTPMPQVIACSTIGFDLFRVPAIEVFVFR